MTNILSAIINISLSANQRFTNDNGLYTGNPKIVYSNSLDSAAITKIFSDGRSVATNETLDVTSLADPSGAAISFTHVKGIVIKNTGTGVITVGGGTTPLLGADQYTISSGRCLGLDTVFTVSTNINLKIALSVAGTYNIILVGN